MKKLIYADELIHKLLTAIECGKRNDMPVYELEAVLADVRRMKAVDTVPVKHGHWIASDPRTTDAFWVCSCCGFPSEAHGAFKLYHYCPQCGALMDEVVTE